jgi:AhpD family alkylhydroperoxidase
MSTIENLAEKEKELVVVAASIASGCVPCTMHHIKSAHKTGASEAEIFAAIRIALDVRDNATEVMGETAQGNQNKKYPIQTQSSSLEQRMEVLVSIAAALACNSVAGLEYHLATAAAAGVSTRQIQTTLGIARAIRKSAAEKADAVIGDLLEPIQVTAEPTDKQKECGGLSCSCS